MKHRRKLCFILIVVFLIVTIVVATSLLKSNDTSYSTEGYQVNFFVEGSLFDVKFVKQGESVYPDEIGFIPGKIFTGWDADLTEIKKDVATNAVFIDTTEKVNCFALDSVYCVAGEKVLMNLMLCGNIDLSTADFSISYNKDILHLEEIQNLDPSFVVNSDEGNGIIYCSMLFDGNTPEGEIDCMQLVFSVSESGTDTELDFNFEDSSRVINNEIVDAETNSIPGKVHVLKNPE